MAQYEIVRRITCKGTCDGTAILDSGLRQTNRGEFYLTRTCNQCGRSTMISLPKNTKRHQIKIVEGK